MRYVRVILRYRSPYIWNHRLIFLTGPVVVPFGPWRAEARKIVSRSLEEVRGEMNQLRRPPSTYDVLRAHGVDRRDFLRFCTATAAAMGLEAAMVPRVVAAMEDQPRIPVIWLHGLECTCCSESFIRSSHPIAQDIVLNMISLDYDDTLQAAAAIQVEEIRQKIMKEHAGEYLLAVEGNAPTKDGGVLLHGGRRSFLNILKKPPRTPRPSSPGVRAHRMAACRTPTPIPPAPSPSGSISQQADHQRAGLPAHRRSHDRRAHLHPHLRPLARTGSPRPPQDVLRRNASTTSATAGRSSMPASSWKPGTTTARARAGAFTKWAAAGRHLQCLLHH